MKISSSTISYTAPRFSAKAYVSPRFGTAEQAAPVQKSKIQDQLGKFFFRLGAYGSVLPPFILINPNPVNIGLFAATQLATVATAFSLAKDYGTPKLRAFLNRAEKK